MPWEKQFDETAVLEKAQRAFWESGYEGTSLATLLDAMGIQKGSFYATFSSKHDVFMAAMQKYVDERFQQLETLFTASSPLVALIQHIHSLTAEILGDDGPLGCLMANAAVEMAPKDEVVRALVQKTFDRHMGLYRKVLDSAVARGELPDCFDSLRVARALFGAVVAMRVLARAGMAPAVIHAIRDQAVSLLGEKPA
jgi:TetR/AcrR family transcriptional regulator, transcriptional repressor for nem operon